MVEMRKLSAPKYNDFLYYCVYASNSIWLQLNGFFCKFSSELFTFQFWIEHTGLHPTHTHMHARPLNTYVVRYSTGGVLSVLCGFELNSTQWKIELIKRDNIVMLYVYSSSWACACAHSVEHENQLSIILFVLDECLLHYNLHAFSYWFIHFPRNLD